MRFPKRWSLTASVLLFGSLVYPAIANGAAPAPVLIAPANGASLVQPITLDWDPVIDPNGPIGSYTWEVGTTSSFAKVVLSGFTNIASETVPAATSAQVSGLSNGNYFWRVKATSLASGDSPWSAVRKFKVTGLGPAPGKPSFTTPANGAQFHALETFNIEWSAVSGAQYYLLEADDEPTFSYPLTLTTTPLNFGTQLGAGWGNEIPNIYYRIRAVSADNVRGLPSATLIVHITNTAPVPPPPSQVSPAAGATVSLPFTFDWTDTPNPQAAGYDLEVDTDPDFGGGFVLFIQQISRSDYMLASDLPPGNYFWRIRAVHGAVSGPWSAGRNMTVVAAPPTPPTLGLFWIIAGPGSVSGGNTTQARVTLNKPAPAGGAVVTVASDLPGVELPGTVTIPKGKTDATVFPITTVPVSGATIGTIRAAYGGGWQQSSLGLLQLLFGTGLSAESVVGGTSFTGTVTLQDRAPAGGVVIRLVSGDTSLVRPPATVSIPAGGTDATFTVTTSPVTVPIRVTIDTGTDLDTYRAPQTGIILTPPGSPVPAPSLSSLTLSQPSVVGGGTVDGTVTLTSPAPAGGAVVTLSGSLEGEVVTPPSVTVPAGSISATFPITVPHVVAPHWVLIQGQYGTSGGPQAKLLEVDPGPPGPPTVLALGVTPSSVTGGNSVRGTVGLVTPAPPGGGVVNLSSGDPSVVHVPATVKIKAGTSANSFNITTSPVTVPTSIPVNATASGVTKSFFIDVSPDPNAPPLLESLTISPTSVQGGTSATGTVTLSAPAPSDEIFVTLATSNPSVAQVPGIVHVPAGQTSADFNVTTFTVNNNTVVTITAFFGDASESADLTVTRNAASPASLLSITLKPATMADGK